MKRSTHIVIMAGGAGTRLYPISTPEHPKQFIDLLGCGRTMIQLTYERFLEVAPDARFWVVTSAMYEHFVREQLPQIPAEQILLEPEPRNTAPCIAYACRKIRLRYDDAVIVNTPADAFVPDVKAFASTMRQALDFASTRKAIVCIGIHPTEPHTGYGYIRSAGGEGVVKVEAFKEKPDLATAESYLHEGSYSWNAGIFVWSAATIEEELRKFAPQICDVMDFMQESFYTEREGQILSEHFAECDKISIDYAVMEKSEDIYTLRGDWAWSDLGSFESIEKVKYLK
ncbi:MAG: mannose-1-phosphate guanylyltransferase [Bacteroidales bacterium]|nr:mannose-1-phosphate guanylyltransferase [Bacteroidales bacterium]